jgi:hypothetical protein
VLRVFRVDNWMNLVAALFVALMRWMVWRRLCLSGEDVGN